MINIWKAEWIKDHAPTEIESIKTHTKELEAKLVFNKQELIDKQKYILTLESKLNHIKHDEYCVGFLSATGECTCGLQEILEDKG